MNARDKELVVQAGLNDFGIHWQLGALEKFADIIRADEREALIRYFDGHYRGRWSEGQIIEALEARGNT